jgi:2-succinyl-6-hydroxy-2,4-cyclohexadiene-1-carboxylate synthase
VNTHFISITLGDGAVVRAQVAGDGPPLILLGNMISWPFWYQQIPFFAQHYRVIAPEYRNKVRPGMSALEAFAADVPDLIHALGYERAAVVGHSIGAMVLARVLQDTPEVLGPTVLANPFLHLRLLHPALHRALHRWQPKLAPLVWVYLHLPWFVRQLGAFGLVWGLQLIFLHREPNSQKRRSFFGYTMTPDVSMVLRLQSALQYHAPPDVSRAQVSVLLVSGGSDHWMRLSEAQQLAKLIPCSEHVVMPSVGHMLPMIAPDVFNAVVLEFLGRAQDSML